MATGTPWELSTEEPTCAWFHYTSESTLATEKNESWCNAMLGCGWMTLSAFGTRLFPPGAQPHVAKNHQHLRAAQREWSSGEPQRSDGRQDLSPGLQASAFTVHRRGCWQ